MEKEKTLETLHNLAEQGYGDDTIWETIDRLENESDAEEIESLKRLARELRRQQAAVMTDTETFLKELEKFMACIPPFAEEDIKYIELNPSLSIFDKWQLKRRIRKNINRQAAEEVKP